MIVLPFPSSKLSGHDKRVNWARARVVKDHRDWAFKAALAAKPSVPAEGDISLHVHFVPSNNLGDRTNFWNRMKPYIDGIADALKINDKRFLPSMSFAPPAKPGRVEISLSTGIGKEESALGVSPNGDSPQNKNGPSACGNTMPGPDHKRIGAAS